MAPEFRLLELFITGPKAITDTPLKRRTFYRRSEFLRSKGYLVRDNDKFRLTSAGIQYAIRQGINPPVASCHLDDVALSAEDQKLIDDLDKAARRLQGGGDPLDHFPQAKPVVISVLEWSIVAAICALTEVIVMKHFGLWHH
jgi:hypothetical protein